jgi:hypothetical protein
MIALIRNREFVRLFREVPGGPLAVPFRLIGKAPASCRGVGNPVTIRSMVLRPAPVFPPGTFLPIPACQPAHLSSASQASAPVGPQEAARARPAVGQNLRVTVHSKSTRRTERSRGCSSRRNNNGDDDDNPLSAKAEPRSKAATSKLGAWGGTPLFLGKLIQFGGVARRRSGVRADARSLQDAEDSTGAPAASAAGAPIPHGVRQDRAERRQAAPAIYRRKYASGVIRCNNIVAARRRFLVFR